MTEAEATFAAELEALRRNAEEASQFLFAHLAINRLAKERRRILRVLQRDSLFWMTVQSALFSSALLAVGRIFDQRSHHNLDLLLKMARGTPELFTREALAQRKRAGGPEPPWLAEYLRGVHVPTADDFRDLRRQVKRLRAIYEAKYRDLRHGVVAHTLSVDPDVIKAQFAKTNRVEFQRLVISLCASHDSLWDLFMNGRKPSARRLRYSAIPPPGIDPSPLATTTPPHQRIVAQAERLLRAAGGLTNG